MPLATVTAITFLLDLDYSRVSVYLCVCIRNGRIDIIIFLVLPAKRNKAQMAKTELSYFLQPLRNKNEERERKKVKSKSNPGGSQYSRKERGSSRVLGSRQEYSEQCQEKSQAFHLIL